MCFDKFGILNDAARVDYGCEGLGGKVTSVEPKTLVVRYRK